MRFKDVDKIELKKLYVDELLSSVELAKLYGVNSTSILKWLKRLDVTIRSSHYNAVSIRKFSNYSKKDIFRMHWVEEKTLREIGEIVGVSCSSVQRYFCRNKLRARSLREERRLRAKLRKLPDSTFCKLYHDRRLGLKVLAGRFGVHHETVRREMMFRGLKVRPVHTCKPINVPNKDDLAYLAGVLAGDGSISDGFSYRLSATDKDFVDFTAAKLAKIAPVSRYVESRKVATWNDMFMVILCRKKFVDLIREVRFSDLSCCRKILFINGFTDSEGCVTDGKGTYPRLVISNNNRELLNEISNFLNEEFELDSKVFPLRYRGGCSCLSLGTQHGLVGFYSLHRFTIRRKQRRFDSIIRGFGL